MKLVPASLASYSPSLLHCPFPGDRVRLHLDKGFTLLELLFALALSSILLAVLYSTFALCHRAMEGSDKWLLKLQEGRMAVDTLRREIESTLNGPEAMGILFKIEDRDLYGHFASGLFMLTYSALLPGPSAVSYRVEERDGEMVLLKRIDPPDSGHAAESGGRWVEVLEGIDSFLVEAKDADRWIKTWDASERKGLPEEVRVTIEIHWNERRISLRQLARPRIERAP